MFLCWGRIGTTLLGLLLIFQWQWGILCIRAWEWLLQSNPSLSLNVEIPTCSGFIVLFYYFGSSRGCPFIVMQPWCRFTGQQLRNEQLMQSFGKEAGWENLGVLAAMTAKGSEGRSSRWCKLCGRRTTSCVLRLLRVAIQWSNIPCFCSLYRKIMKPMYKLSHLWSIGQHQGLFYTAELQKGITF